MGIKYNYSSDNSFMIGMRGSTDYFFINQDKNDDLDIKYNNFGVYVGFAGKVRKK
ncbi:MAG: hypothetical protein ACR2GN_07745 [Bacteroidia bacterium]